MKFIQLYNLIRREFALFFSNRVLLAIFIGAPLVYGLLFGAIYQKGKVTDLPVLIVDEDQSPSSSKLIDMISDNEALHVHKVVSSANQVHQKLIEYGYDAIVTIPDRFEANLLQKRSPELNVDINMANILTANYASKGLQVALGTFNAGVKMEALRKTGMPNPLVLLRYEPMVINYNRFFNPAANYMYFLWPGMLATILQQVLLLALALSFAREFEEDTFVSVFLKQVCSPWLAILIKALPFWLMSLGVWLAYALMCKLFSIPLQVNLLALFVLSTLFTVSVSFLGIMVSVALPSQLKATEVMMVVATPSFVISGFTWPLSQMPDWIQWLAACIPLTHYLEAFRKIFMYQALLSDLSYQVYALSMLCLVFLLGSVLLLSVKIRRIKTTSTVV